MLALAQPLNASVFVYDGLAYAFQDFGFVREAFEVGVGFVFAPSLAAVALAYGAIGSSVPSGVMRGTFETAGIEGPTGVETPGAGLAAIWTCKVALNAWRFAAFAARTHLWSLAAAGFVAGADAARVKAEAETRRGGRGAGRRRRGAEARGAVEGEIPAGPPAAAAPESPVSHWRRRGRRGSGGGRGEAAGDGGGADVEAPLLG